MNIRTSNIKYKEYHVETMKRDIHTFSFDVLDVSQILLSLMDFVIHSRILSTVFTSNLKGFPTFYKTFTRRAHLVGKEALFGTFATLLVILDYSPSSGFSRASPINHHQYKTAAGFTR